MPSPGILLSPTDWERVRLCGQACRAGLVKQCLPLGLLLAILLGLSVPVIGQEVASWEVAGRSAVQTVCVWFIFAISGLTLKTDDVTKAVSAWQATLFGFVSILFITPLLAPTVAHLPLPLPHEFSIGFALFCSMPTTINSGVALAVQAKGSFALALLLTVLTNLCGVFTVPFFLALVLELGRVRIDPVPLLLKLLALILAPLALGKISREASARVRDLVKTHKQALSLWSNLCLVLIPWMSLSQSAEVISGVGAAATFIVVAIGLCIHLCYLCINLAACKVLRLPGDEMRAVVIMASQKTLPMAMATLAALPETIGTHGLIAVPPIICHLVQIFFDAWVATRWAAREPTTRRHRAAGPRTSTHLDAEMVRAPLSSNQDPQTALGRGGAFTEIAVHGAGSPSGGSAHGSGPASRGPGSREPELAARASEEGGAGLLGKDDDRSHADNHAQARLSRSGEVQTMEPAAE